MSEPEERTVDNVIFAERGFLVELDDPDDPDRPTQFGLEVVDALGRSTIIVMNDEQRRKLGEAIERWERGERDL